MEEITQDNDNQEREKMKNKQKVQRRESDQDHSHSRCYAHDAWYTSSNLTILEQGNSAVLI